MRSLVLITIVINVLALTWFVFARVVQPELAALTASGRYTSLDREQVIRSDVLKEKFPDLADNDRHKVPRWIAGEAIGLARTTAMCGIVLSSINIIIARGILIVMRRKDTTPKSEEVRASSSTENA